MNYVMSDLHGQYEMYKAMLDAIKLDADDTLYILGDIADRGTRGVDILFDMMRHTNIVPIIGNHDEFIKTNLYKLMFYEYEDIICGDEDIALWIYNGGKKTIQDLIRLNTKEKWMIIDYLNKFREYAELDINGDRYLLIHAAPKEYSKPFEKWNHDDRIWGRPDYSKRYFDDRILVTGHTPTRLITFATNGRIYKSNGHIAIDCGAAFAGGSLGCICLDTMEEFYIEG